MSFVLDQVHRIDTQLNRLQLAPSLSSRVSTAYSHSDINDEDHLRQEQQQSHYLAQQKRPLSTRALALQAAIRSVTPGSSHSNTLLRPSQIHIALSALSHQPEATASTIHERQEGEEEDLTRVSSNDEAQEPYKDAYERELEWLLVSKATTQVYGTVLKRILDQAVDIANDIWYWDAVLSSRTGTLLYSAQIAPVNFWRWSGLVWRDVQARGGANFSFAAARQDASDTFTRRWRQFYGLVRDVVTERSVLELHRQILSPVTRVRAEIRVKQATLRKIRTRNANALGILLGEGLANECVHGDGVASPYAASATDTQAKWRAFVGRNVALMEAVLAKTTDLETPIDGFDSAIAELTDDDPMYTVDSRHATVSPQDVAERLSRLMTLGLPQYVSSTDVLVKQHGRPSRLVRYWLPITIGLLSSSTVLRILANRQAEMVQWVRDLGTTAIDFWTNWVIEPTRNVIKTIRHDEASAISILSRRSLEGDRDSLERMVVDFAIDNPTNATGSAAKLTETEIADIRLKVREGDLTPVLRAYEKDLVSPLVGAIRGNLIRALLIQVQKTKVDVEVAMGGIDSLLKSQELLIGFISLTPGLLVAYGLLHYFRNSIFSSKQKSAAQRKQGLMLRQLRNIDRILSSAQPTEFGELLYKDQGLLICEAHVLRQAAARTMPGEILREFGEEVEELCDVRVGIERQRRVGERIRWAYGRWLR